MIFKKNNLAVNSASERSNRHFCVGKWCMDAHRATVAASAPAIVARFAPFGVNSMLISVGSKAPAFALPCQPGQVVDLASVIGHEKVVLLFFPLAFSPVCTEELCHFRDAWSKLSAMNCKVFGVSVDSPFVTAKFREMEKLPFPLLSDFNKDVSRAYGALHEDLMGLKGVSKRSAFVIDATGHVKYVSISEDPRVQVDFVSIEKAVQSC